MEKNTVLKKLVIHGFKSITKAEMEFGRVNLFIGANGAGKSNILEAIGVLSAALSRDITAEELQRKGVRLSVPTLFKSAFKHQEPATHFGFAATMDSSVQYNVQMATNEEFLQFDNEQILQQHDLFIERHKRLITMPDKTQRELSLEKGIWDKFSDIIPMPPEIAKPLNSLAKFRIYAPQTSFLRGVIMETNPVKPIGLLGGGLPQAALSVLKYHQNQNKRVKKILDDILQLILIPEWLTWFAVHEPLSKQTTSHNTASTEAIFFTDRFIMQNHAMLSAAESSEGTLYLLFLAILILHEETPRIFALDNVDNALNPSATRALLEKLIAVTCEKKFQQHGLGPEQLFLTSHNPTALDAFDLFNEDQRIFVVSRASRTGFTTIERLQPSPNMSKADWINIKQGKNLSELWIEGLIPHALGSQL